MDCHNLDSLTEVAREHAEHPRHYGPLSEYNGHARITGPCGDTMEVWVQIRSDTVDQASFITDGCGSSLACGSMAVVLVNGKSLNEAASIQQQDILDALDGLPPEFEHCARLAAKTLREACEDFLANSSDKTNCNSLSHKGCGSCVDQSSSATSRREGESDVEYEDRQILQSRLCRISHKIVVLSGKGGVGKSMVAVNLATALMMAGKRVGLLDIDIHGPSIPTMLGLEHEKIINGEDGLLPVELGEMKVMSLGFLIPHPDDAIIWRGPMKMGVIKQFIRDVVWEDLDYLIIDSPPGTGDEPLSVCQLLESFDGAVVVTTPQKVAAVDVRKSITFCRQLGVPVLGVVENMNGFACPKCGEITHILSSGGGRRIADDMNVPFLGSIPMDPKIAEACDSGRVFIHHYAATATAGIMRSIIEPLLALDTPNEQTCIDEINPTLEESGMKIAIPLAEGMLAMHFGHCECFALVDVDTSTKQIVRREDVEAPPHEPGLLPMWLAERGANTIIAGGMGSRAQELFAQQGITVVVGASVDTPEDLVEAYLAGTLMSGQNVCDH